MRPVVCVVIGTLACGALCAVSNAEEMPRPEHPRPDCERAEWLTLNGVWEFGETDADETERFLGADAYPDRIVVPFCRESALSGLQRKGFVKNVWYRRTFRVPAEWRSSRIRLHVGACDWRSRVWVNGQVAGEHVGGNTPFAFDITKLVDRGSENTVVIHAFDDTASGLQPLGKQSITGESHGIFYTPTTGIWQTVWLEGTGDTYIREFRVETGPDTQQVLLEVDLDGPAQGLTIEAQVEDDAAAVVTARTAAVWRDNRLVLSIASPRQWTPRDPHLYGLTLRLLRGGEVVDEVRSYLGIRRITIEGAAILVNGEAIFQRLVLDQGFYPDGVWTAPTDEALKRDIELSMAAGFNGARLHQKVFEPRLLYWADRLGYLLWGEYPSFGANYANPAVNAPILQEWVEVVVRDRNHPSIIGWCPFNETDPISGTLQSAVVTMTRRLDPSRPIIESSGYAHTIADPEVLDVHDYDQNPETFRARWVDGYAAQFDMGLPARYGSATPSRVPFMISEYGGIGWALSKEAWGYGNTPESLDAYYARFAGLAAAALDSRYLFGLCYTQLTNVEQEQNGVYMYDRSPKFDVAPLREALQRKAAYEADPPLAVRPASYVWTVLVGALADGDLARPWRYTTDAPGDGWRQPGFDDGKWNTGLAPFGHKEGEWMGRIRTRWQSDDIWLRQRFAFDGAAFDSAALVLHFDNATEVFLNGQPIWQRDHWNDRYDGYDVTGAFRGAVVTGENTLAVHTHQDSGGQYIDLALLVGRP